MTATTEKTVSSGPDATRYGVVAYLLDDVR
jgi:hypothetical protein